MRLRFPPGPGCPQEVQQFPRRVDVNQVQVVVPEQAQHLLGLALAEQAVVDENAGEALADGQVDQHGGDRGVDAAGQGANDARPAPTCSRSMAVVASMKERHGPDTLEAADAEEKVFQDLGTLGGCAGLRGGTAPRRAAAGPSRIAPVGQVSLLPMTSNPGGACSTMSPWLIHTVSVSPRSWNRSSRLLMLTTWPRVLRTRRVARGRTRRSAARVVRRRWRGAGTAAPRPRSGGPLPPGASCGNPGNTC